MSRKYGTCYFLNKSSRSRWVEPVDNNPDTALLMQRNIIDPPRKHVLQEYKTQ